jgi:hypothetical protein
MASRSRSAADLDGLEAALERAVLLDDLRYSPGVVAPMHWISPRDSAGFRMLAASSEPSADPAPTSVCSSSMKMMAFWVLHQLLHDGLQALFELAAVLGAGDDQREVERQDALVGEEVTARRRRRSSAPALRRWRSCRRPARRSAPDCSWCGGRGSADALEFVIAADQRIELVVHRRLGQVAAELGQQRAFLGRCDCAFSCVVRASSSRMVRAAGRARAGSRRRSTSLRAAAPAADARSRCACARRSASSAP